MNPRPPNRKNVIIPDEHLIILEAEAKRRQWSLPQVIREAIAKYCLAKVREKYAPKKAKPRRKPKSNVS